MVNHDTALICVMVSSIWKPSGQKRALGVRFACSNPVDGRMWKAS